jgi:DNA gyrase subunit A
VVLNNLYKQTQLQSVFGINMVALVDGQPAAAEPEDILEAFLRHRREVVTRRTIFELRKARDRAHILEGLTVALANIDEMIELIKTSPSPQEAKRAHAGQDLGAGPGGRAAVVRWPMLRVRKTCCRDSVWQAAAATSCPRSRPRKSWRCACNRLTGLEQDKLTDEYKRCWKPSAV